MEKYIFEIPDLDNIFEEITETTFLILLKKHFLYIVKANQTGCLNETKQAISSNQKYHQKKGTKSSEYKMAKADRKLVRDRTNQVEKHLDAIANLQPHKQYYAAY